jgi:hypothetical protein
VALLSERIEGAVRSWKARHTADWTNDLARRFVVPGLRKPSSGPGLVRLRCLARASFQTLWNRPSIFSTTCESVSTVDRRKCRLQSSGQSTGRFLGTASQATEGSEATGDASCGVIHGTGRERKPARRGEVTGCVRSRSGRAVTAGGGKTACPGAKMLRPRHGLSPMIVSAACALDLVGVRNNHGEKHEVWPKIDRNKLVYEVTENDVRNLYNNHPTMTKPSLWRALLLRYTLKAIH